MRSPDLEPRVLLERLPDVISMYFEQNGKRGDWDHYADFKENHFLSEPYHGEVHSSPWDQRQRVDFDTRSLQEWPPHRRPFRYNRPYHGYKSYHDFNTYEYNNESIYHGKDYSSERYNSFPGRYAHHSRPVGRRGYMEGKSKFNSQSRYIDHLSSRNAQKHETTPQKSFKSSPNEELSPSSRIAQKHDVTPPKTITGPKVNSPSSVSSVDDHLQSISPSSTNEKTNLPKIGDSSPEYVEIDNAFSDDEKSEVPTTPPNHAQTDSETGLKLWLSESENELDISNTEDLNNYNEVCVEQEPTSVWLSDFEDKPDSSSNTNHLQNSDFNCFEEKPSSVSGAACTETSQNSEVSESSQLSLVPYQSVPSLTSDSTMGNTSVLYINTGTFGVKHSMQAFTQPKPVYLDLSLQCSKIPKIFCNMPDHLVQKLVLLPSMFQPHLDRIFLMKKVFLIFFKRPELNNSLGKSVFPSFCKYYSFNPLPPIGFKSRLTETSTLVNFNDNVQERTSSDCTVSDILEADDSISERIPENFQQGTSLNCSPSDTLEANNSTRESVQQNSSLDEKLSVILNIVHDNRYKEMIESLQKILKPNTTGTHTQLLKTAENDLITTAQTHSCDIVGSILKDMTSRKQYDITETSSIQKGQTVVQETDNINGAKSLMLKKGYREDVLTFNDPVDTTMHKLNQEWKLYKISEDSDPRKRRHSGFQFVEQNNLYVDQESRAHESDPRITRNLSRIQAVEPESNGPEVPLRNTVVLDPGKKNIFAKVFNRNRRKSVEVDKPVGIKSRRLSNHDNYCDSMRIQALKKNIDLSPEPIRPKNHGKEIEKRPTNLSYPLPSRIGGSNRNPYDRSSSAAPVRSTSGSVRTALEKTDSSICLESVLRLDTSDAEHIKKSFVPASVIQSKDNTQYRHKRRHGLELKSSKTNTSNFSTSVKPLESSRSAQSTKSRVKFTLYNPNYLVASQSKNFEDEPVKKNAKVVKKSGIKRKNGKNLDLLKTTKLGIGPDSEHQKNGKIKKSNPKKPYPLVLSPLVFCSHDLKSNGCLKFLVTKSDGLPCLEITSVEEDDNDCSIPFPELSVENGCSIPFPELSVENDCSIPFPELSVENDCSIPFPELSVENDCSIPFPDLSVENDCSIPLLELSVEKRVAPLTLTKCNGEYALKPRPNSSNETTDFIGASTSRCLQDQSNACNFKKSLGVVQNERTNLSISQSTNIMDAGIVSRASVDSELKKSSKNVIENQNNIVTSTNSVGITSTPCFAKSSSATPTNANDHLNLITSNNSNVIVSPQCRAPVSSMPLIDTICHLNETASGNSTVSRSVSSLDNHTSSSISLSPSSPRDMPVLLGNKTESVLPNNQILNLSVSTVSNNPAGIETSVVSPTNSRDILANLQPAINVDNEPSYLEAPLPVQESHFNSLDNLHPADSVDNTLIVNSSENEGLPIITSVVSLPEHLESIGVNVTEGGPCTINVLAQELVKNDLKYIFSMVERLPPEGILNNEKIKEYLRASYQICQKFCAEDSPNRYTICNYNRLLYARRIFKAISMLFRKGNVPTHIQNNMDSIVTKIQSNLEYIKFLLENCNLQNRPTETVHRQNETQPSQREPQTTISMYDVKESEFSSDSSKADLSVQTQGNGKITRISVSTVDKPAKSIWNETIIQLPQAGCISRHSQQGVSLLEATRAVYTPGQLLSENRFYQNQPTPNNHVPPTTEKDCSGILEETGHERLRMLLLANSSPETAIQHDHNQNSKLSGATKTQGPFVQLQQVPYQTEQAPSALQNQTQCLKSFQHQENMSVEQREPDRSVQFSFSDTSHIYLKREINVSSCRPRCQYAQPSSQQTAQVRNTNNRMDSMQVQNNLLICPPAETLPPFKQVHISTVNSHPSTSVHTFASTGNSYPSPSVQMLASTGNSHLSPSVQTFASTGNSHPSVQIHASTVNTIISPSGQRCASPVNAFPSSRHTCASTTRTFPVPAQIISQRKGVHSTAENTSSPNSEINFEATHITQSTEESQVKSGTVSVEQVQPPVEQIIITAQNSVPFTSVTHTQPRPARMKQTNAFKMNSQSELLQSRHCSQVRNSPQENMNAAGILPVFTRASDFAPPTELARNSATSATYVQPEQPTLQISTVFTTSSMLPQQATSQQTSTTFSSSRQQSTLQQTSMPPALSQLQSTLQQTSTTLALSQRHSTLQQPSATIASSQCKSTLQQPSATIASSQQQPTPHQTSATLASSQQQSTLQQTSTMLASSQHQSTLQQTSTTLASSQRQSTLQQIISELSSSTQRQLAPPQMTGDLSSSQHQKSATQRPQPASQAATTLVSSTSQPRQAAPVPNATQPVIQHRIPSLVNQMPRGMFRPQNKPATQNIYSQADKVKQLAAACERFQAPSQSAQTTFRPPFQAGSQYSGQNIRPVSQNTIGYFPRTPSQNSPNIYLGYSSFKSQPYNFNPLVPPPTHSLQQSSCQAPGYHPRQAPPFPKQSTFSAQSYGMTPMYNPHQNSVLASALQPQQSPALNRSTVYAQSTSTYGPQQAWSQQYPQFSQPPSHIAGSNIGYSQDMYRQTSTPVPVWHTPQTATTIEDMNACLPPHMVPTNSRTINE